LRAARAVARFTPAVNFACLENSSLERLPMRKGLLLITLWLLASDDARPEAPRANSTRPLPTRRTALTIPFRIGATQNATQQPVEVQLFTSENQGASWNHVASVKPEAAKLVYQAPRDGEYWFCVRTRDASGNVRPAGAMTPELRVLVDTEPPKLRADAWRGVDGEVTARWDATDSYLNASSVKVFHRRAGSQEPWQNVTINYLLPGDARTSYAENVRWKADSAVDVRVEISDSAGNVAEQIVTAGAPPTQSDTSPAALSPAPRFNPKSADGRPADASAPIYPPADWYGGAGASSSAPSQPPSDLAWPPDQKESKPWPADQSQANPLAPAPVVRPWEDNAPPVGGSTSAPDRGASLATATGQSWLVGTSAFELAYDAGPLPADDIRAVELWGTSDGGRSWRQMAIDEDRRSPVLVKVDAEGSYGFRLLLQRRSGPVEFPPAAGDTPELSVQVDFTEPWCQLTRADQLSGERSQELVICWEARDPHLAERPITLKFSRRPDGPFQTIVAGLENTGRYVWRMPAALPAEIFLRLEVRDRAENVGVFTADRPITPNVSRAQGRLREVAPAASARTTDQRSQPRIYSFK
jgi:hypothetical protein